MLRSSLVLAIVVCFGLLNSVASADFTKDKPEAVCAYLKDHGLQPRIPYNRQAEKMYFAFAQKTIGKNDPASTITYNIDGESETATNVLTLHLAVEVPADKEAAHAELLAVARTLVEKATGEKLPAEAQKAIETGGGGEWKLGANVVSLENIRTNEKAVRYLMQLTIK